MVKRFGLFEFDTGTRELRREGVPVRLQAQPALVLAALVEHAGEVVSREALQKAVWGDTAHGDFESGLNFCIAQVRGALGDSTDSPVFIKTVPKRGYQFVAPVSSPVSHSRRPLLALAVAGASVLAAGVGYWFWPRSHTLRIAVARFENQTGNSGLDRFSDGLQDAVVAELTAIGKFEVIGNAAVLRQARNRQDFAQIREALKADFIVIGQVQGEAAKARALVHLIRLPDQSHRWVTRVNDLDLTGDLLGIESEIAKKASEEFLRKLPTSQISQDLRFKIDFRRAILAMRA